MSDGAAYRRTPRSAAAEMVVRAMEMETDMTAVAVSVATVVQVAEMSVATLVVVNRLDSVGSTACSVGRRQLLAYDDATGDDDARCR